MITVINIKLYYEEIPSDLYALSPEADILLNTLLANATYAKNIPTKKKTQEYAKIEARKATEATVAALLTAPNGLTPGELLAVGESEGTGLIVARVRKYLKEDNLYTLKKRKRKGQVYYYLLKLEPGQQGA